MATAKKMRESRGLLAMSEISLILDNYDDIFSDFDPRPYHLRSLSQDFLKEAKRASRDKIEGLELNLMVPEAKRDKALEENIKKRLHDHFRRHHDILHREIRQFRMHGAIFLLAGLVMMSLAYFLFSSGDIAWPGTLKNVLFVILEPAGWFTAYTGLERIFNIPHRKIENVKFYGKMAGSNISFTEY